MSTMISSHKQYSSCHHRVYKHDQLRTGRNTMMMQYYNYNYYFYSIIGILFLLSHTTIITTATIVHGLQIPTTPTTTSSSRFITTKPTPTTRMNSHSQWNQHPPVPLLTSRKTSSTIATTTTTTMMMMTTRLPSTNHHHYRYNSKLIRINAQLIQDQDPITIPWYKQQSSSSTSTTTTRGISTKQQQEQQRSFTDTSSFLSFLSSLSPSTTIQQQQQQEQSIISSSSTSSKGTMNEMIVSLVKAIVGGGVLTIPASVTTLGDSPQYILPIATILIIIIGSINAYYFSIMGQICYYTNATTFTQAWERTMCIDTTTSTSTSTTSTKDNNQIVSSSSILFSSMICIKTILSCIAYSMIIGESFQSLAMSIGLLTTDDLLSSTSNILIFITCFALLPLCLMKNVSSLAPFSLAGIIGFIYTAGVMSFRAMDGSYHLAPIDTIESGKYLIDLQDPYKPNFGHHHTNSDGRPEIHSGIFVVACTLATAFVSHYNAPRFHNELQNKDQFDTVTYTSFGIAATIMSIIAIAGFTTFGIASAPVILNNYSPYDPLIAAGRIAIAASLVATFPFPFFGLRDSILDIINKYKSQQQQQQQQQQQDNSIRGSNNNNNINNRTNDEINNVLLTVGLLTIITGAALTINDLSLLMSVGGGTIATMVYSVFPTLMYRATINNQIRLLQNQKRSDDEIIAFQQKHQFDMNLSTSLMVVCVITGATGVGLALQNHFIH